MCTRPPLTLSSIPGAITDAFFKSSCDLRTVSDRGSVAGSKMATAKSRTNPGPPRCSSLNVISRRSRQEGVNRSPFPVQGPLTDTNTDRCDCFAYSGRQRARKVWTHHLAWKVAYRRPGLLQDISEREKILFDVFRGLNYSGRLASVKSDPSMPQILKSPAYLSPEPCASRWSPRRDQIPAIRAEAQADNPLGGVDLAQNRQVGRVP